ncbi:GntR family transcriptional regulator [Citricoccus alkalitolerans]|uniref:GntR family transcriptional regulator n=1 Tax=Citricoccus alkalitolerans TaxID=246603 RepID=UPI0031DD5E98
MTPRILLPWHDPSPRSVALRMAALAARRIVEGRYEPGELLTEAHLAEAGGASRTPAREAMLHLQSWGLVRLAPKKGGIVTAVSGGERRDLLDLRAMWEVRSVELVATSTPERSELVAALRTSLEDQRTALDAGDVLLFAEADFGFHLRIIESGGNRVVAQLAAALGPRFARLTYLAASGDLDAARRYHGEHEELLGPIEGGDPTAFETAVRHHIRSAHFPETHQ